MHIISNIDLDNIAGGQMDQLTAFCLNTELRVTAAATEPGFDMTAAAWALHKSCASEYNSFEVARDYITFIQTFLPPGPPPPPPPV